MTWDIIIAGSPPRYTPQIETSQWVEEMPTEPTTTPSWSWHYSPLLCHPRTQYSQQQNPNFRNNFNTAMTVSAKPYVPMKCLGKRKHQQPPPSQCNGQQSFKRRRQEGCGNQLEAGKPALRRSSRRWMKNGAAQNWDLKRIFIRVLFTILYF